MRHLPGVSVPRGEPSPGLAEGSTQVSHALVFHSRDHILNSFELRQLHYARFLSGDGNFKLQRVARKQNSIEPPVKHKSMLGDAGFWVPEDTLSTYMGSGEPSIEEQRNAKVSFHS